jgi:peptidyl-prolyl cis-trans isomerase B (cyclophilin B)
MGIGQDKEKSMSEETTIVIETSKGTITAELFGSKAPKTVANVLQYVDNKHYDGVIFHRVIPGFMVQGGGFTADMFQRPAGKTVENEADNGLKNDRGTLAMARTPDPHSASAQFFINHATNDFLNFTEKSMRGWGYCVFGKVTAGMDVVDAIAQVPTASSGGHQNVPVDPVSITSIRRK